MTKGLLHKGGRPQVGEVARLGGVKNNCNPQDYRKVAKHVHKIWRANDVFWRLTFFYSQLLQPLSAVAFHCHFE